MNRCPCCNTQLIDASSATITLNICPLCRYSYWFDGFSVKETAPTDIVKLTNIILRKNIAMRLGNKIIKHYVEGDIAEVYDIVECELMKEKEK